jgi:hypothetical protein
METEEPLVAIFVPVLRVGERHGLQVDDLAGDELGQRVYSRSLVRAELKTPPVLTGWWIWLVVALHVRVAFPDLDSAPLLPTARAALAAAGAAGVHPTPGLSEPRGPAVVGVRERLGFELPPDVVPEREPPDELASAAFVVLWRNHGKSLSSCWICP